MKKSFERKYSLNVARLKYGNHTDSFDIDQEFFEAFDYGIVKDGQVKVDLDMHKTESHLDITFKLNGNLTLTCDRCLEPYDFPIDGENRIIYAFDPEMNFKGYEVMYVDEKESHLSLVQELYDFITLEVPFRKVPEPKIHLCSPEVLAMLGLDGEGRPEVTHVEEEEREIDPRWEALRKLKDQQDN